MQRNLLLNENDILVSYQEEKINNRLIYNTVFFKIIWFSKHGGTVYLHPIKKEYILHDPSNNLYKVKPSNILEGVAIQTKVKGVISSHSYTTRILSEDAHKFTIDLELYNPHKIYYKTVVY